MVWVTSSAMSRTRNCGKYISISEGASDPGTSLKTISTPSITRLSMLWSIAPVGAIKVNAPRGPALPKPASTWPRGPAGSNLGLADHTLDAAEVVGVAVGINYRANRLLRPVLIVKLQRGARGIGR